MNTKTLTILILSISSKEFALRRGILGQYTYLMLKYYQAADDDGGGGTVAIEVLQTWLLLLSVHSQICVCFPLVKSPLVRSRQKPSKKKIVSFRPGSFYYIVFTLVSEGNSLVVSVEPILSWQIVETLPDLHSGTVSWGYFWGRGGS